ncbi:DUF4040 domain-containing protein [Pleionea litopenaei]|uniref:DUF4040 domain-containing protein n=1 Tax=Pleionea litopenaei TaxID=3070815 RepID=UPI003F4947B1
MNNRTSCKAEETIIELFINISLLCILVATSIYIARSRDLLAATMLFSIYGLVSASFFMNKDAVDVAFTEAAVGAGISPLLMLATLAIVGRFQKKSAEIKKPIFALILVFITGALLIVGTLDMPAFGAANSPAQQHVAPRYINDSVAEIGIPNMVTSVLASYRAYDTLGEVVVIFTAGIGVLMLLGLESKKNLQTHLIDKIIKEDEHKILRIVVKILIAPILIFALYVQFHGDFGPGGGFQAGVIFAAAIILYTLFFGLEVGKKVVNLSSVRFLSAVGVLLYGSVGVVSLLSGKNYLDYSVLSENPQTAQHIGIVVIELGVGITVACVMLSVFFAFFEKVGKEMNTNEEVQ